MWTTFDLYPYLVQVFPPIPLHCIHIMNNTMTLNITLSLNLYPVPRKSFEVFSNIINLPEHKRHLCQSSI